MKKFILQMILFTLIGITLYDIQREKTTAGCEIYHSIKKSKQKNSSKILIIGDSVGKQLFNNYSYTEPINSLACNQTIGMVGQYCLLQNYFNSGNHVDKVYLIVTPLHSLKNNLNQIYTYHYFLKPFYIKEYYGYFSNLVSDQIRKIPYYQFCQFPFISTSTWAPDFKSNDKIDYSFLSPISVEYLKKIKDLSEQKKFEFIILPTPTKVSYKKKIEDFDSKEIILTGLDEEFKYYFESIMYVADSSFYDDVHLKNPMKYTEIYENKWFLK